MGPTGIGEKDPVLRSLQGNRQAWTPPCLTHLGLPTANRTGQPHCAERPPACRSHLQKRSAGGCLLASRFSALTSTRIMEYGVGLSVCLPVYLSVCAQPLPSPGCRDPSVRLSSLYPSLEASCQNTSLRIFQTCTVHLDFLLVPRFSVARLSMGVHLYTPLHPKPPTSILLH